MCAQKDISAHEGSVHVHGHQTRYTCVRGVYCKSWGEGGNTPFQHPTSHAPRPLSTDTFGPVCNHGSLDATEVECMSTLDSGCKPLAHCTCARGVKLLCL